MLCGRHGKHAAISGFDDRKIAWHGTAEAVKGSGIEIQLLALVNFSCPFWLGFAAYIDVDDDGRANGSSKKMVYLIRFPTLDVTQSRRRGDRTVNRRRRDAQKDSPRALGESCSHP
jgi:hypothetical protein